MTLLHIIQFFSHYFALFNYIYRIQCKTSLIQLKKDMILFRYIFLCGYTTLLTTRPVFLRRFNFCSSHFINGDTYLSWRRFEVRINSRKYLYSVWGWVCLLVIKINESRYIALFVVSGFIKKLFTNAYVNIYLFKIFFAINFTQWKSVVLLHIAYIVIH